MSSIIDVRFVILLETGRGDIGYVSTDGRGL
jgi:hypothetical protein